MFWWGYFWFGINTRTIYSLFVLDDKYFSLPTLVGVFYTVFHDIIFKGAWFTMDKMDKLQTKGKTDNFSTCKNLMETNTVYEINIMRFKNFIFLLEFF